MDRPQIIEIYEDLLLSKKRQIEREKEGIILDSGRAIPQCNTAAIKELEEDLIKYEAEIVKLKNSS